MWAVAARRNEILEVPAFDGDLLVASCVAGRFEVEIDGTIRPMSPRLHAALAERGGDVSIVAQWLAGDLWAADVSSCDTRSSGLAVSHPYTPLR